MADEAKVASTPGTEPAGGAPATTPAAPTVYDLSDDVQVRLPGQKEPAKFGDWYRGLQQKITTTGRERSDLAKRLEQINSERQREQEELGRLRTAMGVGQAPPKPKPLSDGLKDLSYLDGRTGADVVSALESRLGQFESAIEVRDRALKFLAGKLAETMQTTQTISQRESANARMSRIREVMKDLDIPDDPAALELAQDIYHSYEGDELDEKFPELLKARWEGVSGLIRAHDKRRVDTARKQRFVAPAGGNARPGKMRDLSQASAKETAEALWAELHGDTT